MLLLHVSDIHFQAPQCHTGEDPELYFRSELLTHASEQAEKLGDIYAILVTGDIAFKGISSEYEAATKWLEALANAVGCKKGRIYVVPGNHDVDRGTFNEIGGARNAVSAITGKTTTQGREEELNVQLSMADSAENMFASIQNYNLFAAKYDCQSIPGQIRWKHKLRIDSQTVLKMHGLNSVLISGITGNDNKPGELYMGARQLNIERENGTVNLVMAHHPPDWMSDYEDIQTRVLGAPNLVLFGHKHIQRLYRDVDGYMMFSAGSVNPERHENGWEPAYNIIDITPRDGGERRQVDIVVRQYHWQSNPSGFVCKQNLETDEYFFRHQMMVRGVDVDDTEGANAALKGEETVVTEESRIPEEPLSFAGPNIRDLIYRFWELTPLDRRRVLIGLGCEIPENPGVRETMTYRAALVNLSRNNKLTELEEAIVQKEARK